MPLQEENSHSTDIPRDYKGILESKRMAAVSDKQWDELDTMDDNHADKDDKIFNEFHKKEGFTERMFTLVSLQKIQSIISVLKQQIESKKSKQMEDKLPFIIAISDEQLLFDSKGADTKHTTNFDTTMPRCLTGNRT